MSLKFKALGCYRQWFVELESFVSVPEDFDPSDLDKILSTKNFTSLKSAVDDFRKQRGGDVLFITRNPVLEGYANNLNLSLESEKDLVTEQTLPELKHGMNGGGTYRPYDVLAFVSSEDIADDFSNLGAKVVWMDQQKEDIEEARQNLISKPNVLQVTVPDYLFMMIRHQWHAEQTAARRAGNKGLGQLLDVPEYTSAIS